MRRVERRVLIEIERSNGCGAPAIQVAVYSGSCDPQQQTLRRVARPEDFALRLLYCEISSDAYSSFKTSYEDEHKKVCFGVRWYEN